MTIERDLVDQLTREAERYENLARIRREQASMIVRFSYMGAGVVTDEGMPPNQIKIVSPDGDEVTVVNLGD